MVVLIVGRSYGSDSPDADRSFTHEELDVVRQDKIPCLAYIRELDEADIGSITKTHYATHLRISWPTRSTGSYASAVHYCRTQARGFANCWLALERILDLGREESKLILERRFRRPRTLGDDAGKIIWDPEVALEAATSLAKVGIERLLPAEGEH